MTRLRGSEGRPKTWKELENISVSDFYSGNDFIRAEISSAGVQANARGLAKLASIMSIKGDTFMSEETWKTLHSEPKELLFGELPGELND